MFTWGIILVAIVVLFFVVILFNSIGDDDKKDICSAATVLFCLICGTLLTIFIAQIAGMVLVFFVVLRFIKILWEYIRERDTEGIIFAAILIIFSSVGTALIILSTRFKAIEECQKLLKLLT